MIQDDFFLAYILRGESIIIKITNFFSFISLSTLSKACLLFEEYFLFASIRFLGNLFWCDKLVVLLFPG